MAHEDIIDLEEGFKDVNEKGIQPFLKFIEEEEREFFKAKDYVALYDLIFKMCIQRDPFNWSEQMYERYAFVIHIVHTTVATCAMMLSAPRTHRYTHSIMNYLNNRVVPKFNEARNSTDTVFMKAWKTR